MQLAARYSDGMVARMHEAVVDIDAALARPHLRIADPGTGAELARWPLDALYSLPSRRDELRLGATGLPAGARLVLSGADAVRDAHLALPTLHHQVRRENGRQLKLLGMATAALVSVIAAYVVGVPLLASRITALVPPPWEAQLGETARRQVEAMIGEEAGFSICDPSPSSLANRAIARFAAATMAGSGSPFAPDIQVVRSDIANAFALPGGHAYYFSALLAKTESADEFAGVMAHELGHVAFRHGMEGLIASSATGLLVGFVLGDMTGLSIAGGIGAALIDTRFSRDAERDADRFAADAARRLGFDPAALANLLERVAADDEMSAALALLSTHPLTADRRAALEAMAREPDAGRQVFSTAEWRAIKAMCGPPRPS